MIRITWLGHSNFELRFETGEVLLLDPWIEGNPAYPKDYKVERADAIAVSHAHFDHFGDVLSLGKKLGSKVVCIFETSLWLQKNGLKDAVGINKGGTVDLGFVKLTMTHALHSNAIKDGDEMVYAGEAAGYILTFNDGRRAYYAGDTALFGDMALLKDLYHPELAFLPIGDHFTMGPDQAAVAARLVGAKRVIPMHYGTFPALTGRPEDLASRLEQDGIQVWTLKQGEAVEW